MSPSTQDTPPRPSADHELRIQLEGAWEVLEQAQDLQAALSRLLASRRWRHSLGEQPGLLRQVRELEVPLAEALARVEHRLGAGAFEHASLEPLLHQSRTQRARLLTRVHERLGEPDERGESLARALERLEEALREQVLFSLQRPPWGSLLALVISLGLGLGFGLLVLHSEQEWRPALSMMLPFLIVGFPHVVSLSRASRFLLTAQRLEYQSPLGKTRVLALERIQNGGLTLEPEDYTRRRGLLEIRVRGRQHPLHLVGDMAQMERLHALLARPRGAPGPEDPASR